MGRRLRCGDLRPLAEPVPFKEGAGVGFSVRCNVFMPGHRLEVQVGISPDQGPDAAIQGLVLRRFEGFEIRSLHLDADGKIIADAPAPVTGEAGMPGPLIKRDELDKGP